MAAADELRRFAAGHRLVIVSLTELIEWRSEQEKRCSSPSQHCHSGTTPTPDKAPRI